LLRERNDEYKKKSASRVVHFFLSAIESCLNLWTFHGTFQSRSIRIAEIITLRAESYDKDEFPEQGWPTTIAAFRRNPVPWYGLGWFIPGDMIDTYLRLTTDWWSPRELKYAVFVNKWFEYGYAEK